MIHIQVLTTPAVLEYLLLFRLKYIQRTPVQLVTGLAFNYNKISMKYIATGATQRILSELVFFSPFFLVS